MKKQTASQSAFFNPRVLVGLSIILVGVVFALASFGVLSATAASIVQALDKHKIITSSNDPLVPVGFDCSTIHQKGIDKQENFRAGAIMMACGESPNNGTTASSTLGSVARAVRNMLAPFAPSPQAYGGADVDLITGPEISPNITQSETYTLANPDDPNQILAAYNDSRGRNASPINISGASFSTDGGTTFTRLTTGTGQSPFAGTEGDPVALYNKPTGTWLTVWLDTLCGAQGLGGYKSTTPANPASWTHFCLHNSSGDDRESGWSDNNPASPFYGRMYISWDNGNPINVTYSTDNGVTWHAPITVTSGSPFIRNVQITGDLSGNGDLYIAGMNENGSTTNFNRNNLIFRSTDGGNTWTNTYTGPTFQGPGVTNSGYFACMFTDGGGYWRHEGWGEPAVFNHVVSLVYASRVGPPPADAGDVYYIRSTDSGVTFGAPVKLNTDATTRPQWQPNISVSPTGTLLATWYDGREFPNCVRGNPAVPCYRMWSRKSNDNGVTWLPDDAFSDAPSALPAQNDPGIQPTYAGDYDYGSATAAKHVTSWTDGRVAIGGTSQQDAFTDRELVGFAVTSTTPACNSVINTQPLDFVINLSDAVNPGTVQAADFTVNGIPANSFVLSNGNLTITFHFNASPVTTQGSQTMHIAAGAFTRVSDGMGVFDFSCSFCYAVTALQVTSTVPAVGGTFTPPAPGNYNFDVNFNQAVDAGSVQMSDLMVSGNSGPSVTGVSLINGGTTARFTLHMNFGGTLDASIGAGAITANGCNGNAAFAGSYTVQGCPPADHYAISQIGGSIVPGTTDVGNHIDDGLTNVSLPFSVTLYDQTYTSINVSSNGNAQFVTTDNNWTNVCLPWASHDYTIFPYWDDQRTDTAGSGIFTSVSGIAPNRIFNIEWRTTYFSGTGTANYEVRLYEGQSRFDIIYGTISQGNASATAGVQKNDSAFDQYFCSGSGSAATGGQSYIITPCNQPTVNSAVSRKAHGAAGNFDINLPLTGTPGIECRTTPGTTDYSIVVTFTGNVTVSGSPQASVTSGTGCVGSGGVCMGGNNVTVSGAVVTIPLTNVANAQTINVRLNGVNSAADQPAADIDIPMTILIGDTNANGAVSSADVAQTKSRVGLAVDNTTFRSDVNVSGAINSSDVTIVKQHLP